jgi:hypothetical protein
MRDVKRCAEEGVLGFYERLVGGMAALQTMMLLKDESKEVDDKSKYP